MSLRWPQVTCLGSYKIYLSLNTVTLSDNRVQIRDVKPRYCRFVKAENEDYGLYVVIDNKRIGQVIRWVDCGGPADRAGLRIGDRIVEVNGHSVEYESHENLIKCISSHQTLTHFIVVDEEYDEAYKRFEFNESTNAFSSSRTQI